jgi:hypothetical protein
MNDNLEAQESDNCDVFDMERMAKGKSAERQHVPADEEEAKKPDLTRKVESQWRIGPLHFAAASIILGAIWVFWPNSGTPGRDAIANGNMLDTNARGNEKTRPDTQAVPKTAATVENRMPVSGTALASEGVTTNAAPALLQDRILEQQAQQALALIAAVDSLNARVSALEARPAPSAQAPAATNSVPAAKKATEPQASQSIPAPVLDDYALNTIYDGQAWIEHQQQIHVVRVGDVLGTAKVIRINARDHNVLTTQGVVR